jgi:hypothetical protein
MSSGVQGNVDFNVRFTEEYNARGIEYNYRREAARTARAPSPDAGDEMRRRLVNQAHQDQASFTRNMISRGRL